MSENRYMIDSNARDVNAQEAAGALRLLERRLAGRTAPSQGPPSRDGAADALTDSPVREE